MSKVDKIAALWRTMTPQERFGSLLALIATADSQQLIRDTVCDQETGRVSFRIPTNYDVQAPVGKPTFVHDFHGKRCPCDSGKKFEDCHGRDFGVASSEDECRGS